MKRRFNVMPLTLPGTFNDFAAFVVPELQRRGRFRIDYGGTTLRDHLGLSKPPLKRSAQSELTRKSLEGT